MCNRFAVGKRCVKMPGVIHLHPTADLAERVLLPGDPGRAFRLAQGLLENPSMFNHNRGLWGYTGTAPDGHPLTIQTTGMGGPSAAIVTHELIELGARRLLRVGTCGALRSDLHMGQLVVASEALSDDGASKALADLAPLAPVAATPLLLAALRDVAGPDVADGPVVSTDLFYDAADRHQSWIDAGALAVEMEAATVFTIAHRRDVEAGCALLISDTLVDPDGFKRIEEHELHAAELALGRLAVAALAV
jgi:DeoD family purine-nucleoside phosphorylase